MAKTILFGKNARQALRSGVNQISNAVRATFGYSGRNVIISNPRTFSYATRDGVTCAREILLKDPIENAGALTIKGVATKQLQECGDGTTCATILAQAIINGGLDLIDNNKTNSVDLKKGIEAAVKVVVENLYLMADRVNEDFNKIKNIATIASNNDVELGQLIAEAYQKIGKDGIVNIEDSKSFETTVEVVSGMQIDRGYASPFFAQDNPKMICEFEKPLVLIYDSIISNAKELIPLCEYAAKNGRAMVVIAEDITGEALQVLVVNKMKGLPFCAVKAPQFGDLRADILEDIAIVTGGVVVSKTKGDKLERAKPEIVLGQAEKIIIKKDDTVIVNGFGDIQKINDRVEQVKIKIEDAEHDADKKRQEERLAKMKGGIAIIKVGAISEIEMKEKKDRVDDAVRATKAAIEEGVVPGAGTAFIRCIPELDKIKLTNKSQQKGVELIKKVLEAPLRQICENSGKSANDIVNKVKNGKFNYGYNGKTEQVVDLILAGVIDPVKVCRFAIENAASVGAILITSEVLLVEEEK